jgi:hypothetical protein
MANEVKILMILLFQRWPFEPTQMAIKKLRET